MSDELCKAIQMDLGRGPFYAYVSEVHLVLSEIDNAINNFEEWAKPRSVDTPFIVGPGTSYVRPEPLGVILVMSAWNYPIYTLLGPASQCIAAGNCLALKPSEVSPNCCLALHKLCEKYLDDEFYRPVLGQVEVAKTLTSMKFDMIVFTGSSEKGKLVAAAAGKNLVPCVLELGGKSPAIIDDSANASFAAKKVLFGKMPNLGQVCIAPDYIFCHRSKLAEFLTELKRSIVEDYKNCETPEDSGKIINEFHLRRICALLKDHGGDVYHGNAKAHEDLKLQPTIILEPDLKSDLMKDEIFGPIFPVLVYDEIDEVISYVTHGQDKPLCVYYFGSMNGKNKQRVEEETSSGSFVVNDTIYQILNPYLPFGGVGKSGQGRYHGLHGFNQFSNMKSVLVKPTLAFFPFNILFPPYTDTVKQLSLIGLKNGNITQAKLAQRTLVFLALVALLILGFIYQELLMGFL